MVFCRVLVKAIVIFSFFITSGALLANFEIIKSIDEAEDRIRSLRAQGVKAEDIGVIVDFHGVVVNEEVHQEILSLKGNSLKTLGYLKSQKIPFVIATAWDDFNAVIQGIESLGLSKLLSVNPQQINQLEDYAFGKNKSVPLKGYQNGRVIALKRATDFDISDNEKKDPYFRQKIFALETLDPLTIFRYLFVIEDSEGNLNLVKKDFLETIYNGHSELILLHLQDPIPVNDSPIGYTPIDYTPI